MLATIHPSALPILIVGVALLIWNRRVSRALAASQQAFADTLGVRWLQRWTRLVNRSGFPRGFLIVWSLLAILLGVLGFSGVTHTQHHH